MKDKARLIKKKDVVKSASRKKPAVKKPDTFSIDVRVKIAGRGGEASKARAAWKRLFGK